VNRFTACASTVTRGLAVCGLVAAALTGCSAGQQAQTSAMEPAVNGTSATVKNIALRDVRIQAIQTTDALRPGKSVDLLFVAVNQSPDANDTLLNITSEVGQISTTGPKAIPAGGALVVGAPDSEKASPMGETGATGTTKSSVTLAKAISNGLTYDFTFHFEKAGDITVPVPITAGVNAPRLEQPGPAEQGGAH
jgi:copper(I)-binding protein